MNKSEKLAHRIMKKIIEQRERDVDRYKRMGGFRSHLRGERTYYLQGRLVDEYIRTLEE